MSFASDAKTELCNSRLDRHCCALAECYGILLFCSSFSASEIRIVTSNDIFAQKLPKLFHKAFSLDFDSISEPAKFGAKFSFKITDSRKLRIIFDSFGLAPDSPLHINLAILENDCCRISFLKGAFLAGGSVSDPEKSFHLELSTSHQAVSRELIALLLELEFTPRETFRAGKSLIYFKRSEYISNFLTVIGAPIAGMNIETASIEKDMNNKIVRSVNCDTANADKVVLAAQAHIAAIKKLSDAYGLDGLTDDLRSVALLRVTNPEASLADLALLSVPKLSKSSISHRLKKIVELAARLDEKNSN